MNKPRAWKVFVRGFGFGNEPVAITVAPTRARARYKNWVNATEAGYAVKFADLHVVRSPEHDRLIEKEGHFNFSFEIAERIRTASG